MRILQLLAFTIIYMKFVEAKEVRKKDFKNTTNSVTDAPSGSQVITTTRRPPLPGFKLPCSCFEGQCGCCTGVILDQFNQKACLNVTYEPDEFALTAAASVNGRQVFKRTVSGKNPPPMCFRVPRLPFIRFCIEFSNVYFASRNVHLCIDMEANWEDITLVEWSFDCIRMGVSGVAVVRPEEGGGIPTNPIDVVDQTDEDYDDSARNAPLPLKTFIIDESVKLASGEKFDKSLIKLRRLPSGDVRLSYGKL